jgi:hypothetical protein
VNDVRPIKLNQRRRSKLKKMIKFGRMRGTSIPYNVQKLKIIKRGIN